MNKLKSILCLFFLATMLFNCQQPPPEPGSEEFIRQVTMAVDDAAIMGADANQGDWLSYGRNYQEDRYSELDQINKDNLDRLGLDWSLNLNTKRGLEATPIVVDGIMYMTGAWSKVFAIDARKGTIIWEYDPKVDPKYAEIACCDVVNRGVALYKGAVYFGSIDGRLISLDAATGAVNWEIMTVDGQRKYTITGSPRIVNGMVLIGNGGAEYDARGYVTAYDAANGDQKWRFYTVPGNPAEPFENEILEEAAKTWKGEWWKQGGGGTVWDAITYDPELNMVYIGVGNGTPWDQIHRSPGGGDNLFLSSIVALNADDGKYIWHYQTTPGDTWDYTATQHLVQADIEIEGTMRKVIMQAPKNGFFYVIDRVNGEFISADEYTYQNWAKGIDEDGRPIEEEYARYNAETNVYIYPGAYGGHNWQPMSYNRKNGLMYIPTHTVSVPYSHNPAATFNSGEGLGGKTGWNISFGDKLYKPLSHVDPEAPNPLAPFGRLVAFDPITQEEKWSVKQSSTHWNGGIMSTANGMVLQGDAEGNFKIFDADTGTLLWERNLMTGIIAPPITYMIDGKQYITIPVGWGGIVGMNRRFTETLQPGRLYTFSLDADNAMPESINLRGGTFTTLEPEGTPLDMGKGFNLYAANCILCHGDAPGTGGSITPDLSWSTDQVFENYKSIVIDGSLASEGMPAFPDLSEEDLDDIKEFMKFTSKHYREGGDPLAWLTAVATAQYAADVEAAKGATE